MKRATVGLSIVLTACGASSDAGDSRDPPQDGGRDGDPVDADAGQCRRHIQLERAPLDIFVLVDRTSSMSSCSFCEDGTGFLGESAFRAVESALIASILSPEWAGTGVGLAFFPRATSTGADCTSTSQCASGDACISGTCHTADCEEGSYGLDADVMRAPAGTSALSDAFAEFSLTSLRGSTVPAFRGVVSDAREHRNANREKNVAIVLLTDDEPTACSGDLDTLAAVAGEAKRSVPSIRTYPIALDDDVDFEMVAAASGTFQRVIGEEADLKAALKEVRSHASRCEYALPTGLVVSDIVEVRQAGESGSPVPLASRVSECAIGGVYLDNPLLPRRLVVCASDCSSHDSGLTLVTSCDD